MKIHAILTGTVAIKTRQVQGVGRGGLRQLNMLLDREWTEPLPIYAYAIEHPEGLIVVDTGETARASEPGYFPSWHPYYRFGVRLFVEPEQEIGAQLQALGIAPRDVPRVVMTHMHTDHAGGLHSFPHSEILTSRDDAKLSAGRLGLARGYPSNRHPAWLDPSLVDLPSQSFGPFPHSLPLTRAGDVTLVGLPGHTPGHMGVVIQDGDHNVLIAGDASYNQDLMLRGVIDGVSPSESQARLTQERIRTLAAGTPTVYLVAHDRETGARLAQRRTIDAAWLKSASA